tara:strand:+ start:6639 stop:7379 length:741 start_codon:yes stop_codon:yes gene_type:complete
MLKKIINFFFLILLNLTFSQDKSKLTEIWEPIPKKIEAYDFSKAPSDAIILFDGKNFSNWITQYSNEAPKWKINSDGSMTVVNGTGGIKTKESFGSVQLHIEWKTSQGSRNKKPQYNSNSGVFLQSKYELQVLDSYENPTFVNGQAGSIYKQHAPLVNSSKKPGVWQSYDIIFNAPKFKKDELIKPAFFTVFQNGVLIQNHVEVQGATTNVGLPKYNAHRNLPLVLQDHPSLPISFRNIWIRKIND